MKQSITRVILLGALSIFGILAVQGYWLLRAWDAKEKEFNEKVLIALTKVVDEFEKMGSQVPDYDLINRINSNYYVVNINDVINANNLEFFLRRELEAVGMQEDFEFGIYDCASNEMLYGDYISYENKAQPKEQRKDLQTYNEYIYYFGVRFPTRTATVFESMTLVFVFASILLLTVIFFLYSLLVIMRQRRLSEMQKDFINNMTHEFKTPISTIAISANVFANHDQVKQDPRLKQYTQIILEQNDRLNGQVEKVLQLARLERENFQLKLEEVDVSEIAHQVSQAVALAVTEKGGTLEMNLAEGLPLIEADKLHLTNIMNNLLDNAMKYCQEVPEITVSTKKADTDGVVLLVADRGIGIPKDQQRRVFNKFFRVSTGNVHNVKGFGLGLYYIRSVCEAHGWEVSIESELNQGTTLRIFMPSKARSSFLVRAKRSVHRLFGY